MSLWLGAQTVTPAVLAAAAEDAAAEATLLFRAALVWDAPTSVLRLAESLPDGAAVAHASAAVRRRPCRPPDAAGDEACCDWQLSVMLAALMLRRAARSARSAARSEASQGELEACGEFIHVNAPPRVLFCSFQNIPEHVDAAELKAVLEGFPGLLAVRLVRKRSTGTSRGHVDRPPAP